MQIINFKRILSLAFFSALISSPFLVNTTSAQADEYAIIVNADSQITADDNELRNIYLKKQTKWSSGVEAIPFGRATHSPEQNAFLINVLGMNQAELDSYWASAKSKSGLTGPREVQSVSILLRQVRRKEGAFGVISSSDASDIPEGVKVLKSF